MKNIEKSIAAVAILVILIYTAINYYNKLSNKTAKSVATKQESKRAIFDKNNLELSYIIDVINNGSNHLNFKGGEMEGGFVPKAKAKDVACYLLNLRGKPCKSGYSKDAALYFSSNCAGCHGVNAKGIKGSYPNLLREPLLGFKQWKKEHKSF